MALRANGPGGRADRRCGGASRSRMRWRALARCDQRIAAVQQIRRRLRRCTDRRVDRRSAAISAHTRYAPAKQINAENFRHAETSLVLERRELQCGQRSLDAVLRRRQVVHGRRRASLRRRHRPGLPAKRCGRMSSRRPDATSTRCARTTAKASHTRKSTGAASSTSSARRSS